MKSNRSPVSGALADPRLRCARLGSRGVYVELLRMADALKSPIIRFGDHVPTLIEISKAISAGTEEVSAALDELAEFGLIQRGDRGAITVSALQRQFDRTEINRANGAKGGRPRKSSDRILKGNHENG